MWAAPPELCPPLDDLASPLTNGSCARCPRPQPDYCCGLVADALCWVPPVTGLLSAQWMYWGFGSPRGGCALRVLCMLMHVAGSPTCLWWVAGQAGSTGLEQMAAASTPGTQGTAALSARGALLSRAGWQTPASVNTGCTAHPFLWIQRLPSFTSLHPARIAHWQNLKHASTVPS